MCSVPMDVANEEEEDDEECTSYSPDQLWGGATEPYDVNEPGGWVHTWRRSVRLGRTILPPEVAQI